MFWSSKILVCDLTDLTETVGMLFLQGRPLLEEQGELLNASISSRHWGFLSTNRDPDLTYLC